MSKPKTGPLNEQIAAANAQRDKANAMGTSFTDIMNTQLGQQNSALAQYLPQLQAFMSQLQQQQGDMVNAANAPVEVNPMEAKQLAEGLSPTALAALKGQAIDRIPAGYDQAMQAQKAAMGARGFGGEGGMGNLQAMMGNLYSQREQARSGALRDITMSDEALRREAIEKNRAFNLSNLQNAQQFGLSSKGLNLQGLQAALSGGTSLYGNQANTLNMLLSAYDPAKWGQLGLGTLGAGNQATGIGMQGANTLATLPSFWNNLLSSAVGGATGALTGGFTGGFPSIFKRKSIPGYSEGTE